LAVTVVFALRVTAHVMPLVEAQPVQEENVFAPEVAGAVSVTLVPELYVRVKLVLPEVLPLLSAGLTPIATPVEGFMEFTVSV
jgi:hypothetical protein